MRSEGVLKRIREALARRPSEPVKTAVGRRKRLPHKKRKPLRTNVGQTLSSVNPAPLNREIPKTFEHPSGSSVSSRSVACRIMGRMPHTMPICPSRILAVFFAVPLLFAADAAPREWPVYGGGPESIRHSTLKRINRANVNQLAVAWSYDAQDGPGGLQTNPIIVGGG